VVLDPARGLRLARPADDDIGLVSLPEDVDVLRVPSVVERLHQFLVPFFGARHHFLLTLLRFA
jgi:hypothetical protein